MLPFYFISLLFLLLSERWKLIFECIKDNRLWYRNVSPSPLRKPHPISGWWLAQNPDEVRPSALNTKISTSQEKAVIGTLIIKKEPCRPRNSFRILFMGLRLINFKPVLQMTNCPIYQFTKHWLLCNYSQNLIQFILDEVSNHVFLQRWWSCSKWFCFFFMAAHWRMFNLSLPPACCYCRERQERRNKETAGDRGKIGGNGGVRQGIREEGLRGKGGGQWKWERGQGMCRRQGYWKAEMGSDCRRRLR